MVVKPWKAGLLLTSSGYRPAILSLRGQENFHVRSCSVSNAVPGGWKDTCVQPSSSSTAILHALLHFHLLCRLLLNSTVIILFKELKVKLICHILGRKTDIQRGKSKMFHNLSHLEITTVGNLVYFLSVPLPTKTGKFIKINICI